MSVRHDPDWLTLDNAAKIYPPSYSEHAPEVFRVGVDLKSPIKYEALQSALQRTIQRCPYYQVHLRRGLFWYYLQRHAAQPRIELLEAAPVSRIRMRDKTAHLFRVFARDHRVRVDFSHVLTDGSGAFRFLSTMIGEYLRQLGTPVPATDMVMNPDEAPGEEEFRDAYPDLYSKETPKPDPLSPAYHVPGTPVPGLHRTITGHMPGETVVGVARSYGASLTEFLVAVYIKAILEIRGEERRPPRGRNSIRIEVPVDVRRIHPSRTMRNFSLFVSPELDLRLGDISFPELVKTVHHMIRLQLDPRAIRRQIARNVGGENLTLIRIIPLIFKDWYLSTLHYRLGGNLYSGVVSNLGNLTFPDAMAEHISNVSFVLGPNPVTKKAVSVVGFNKGLSITIGSVILSRRLEELFFTRLVSLGVPVRVLEK